MIHTTPKLQHQHLNRRTVEPLASMLNSSRRGVLVEGGRRLCPREVLRGLRSRTRNGSDVVLPIQPSGKGGRCFSTNVRKMALPMTVVQKKLSATATASAAVATVTAAVTATIIFVPESNEVNSGDMLHLLPSEKSGWTSNLLIRPSVSCAYRRRIQDMYSLVDSPVGQGAFGIVCAGVHKVTGELVAVKQIPRKFTKPARLQSEVDLLRMAGQHSNIVNFRDLFSDEAYYYIVMEFATGGELFDRLVHEGAYSEHDAACLVREVTDALAYLHGNSVVHFDIKPENIMLHSSDSDSMDVKLVDFGSAFVVGSDGVSVPRKNSGTVAYSAPEVLRGEPFGTAADMWSLGIVLYIILCGAHPFDLEGGAKDEEVRERVLAGDVSFADPVWAGKNGAINLIKRLLEVDPKLRPTANEVLRHPWMEERAKLSRRPMTLAAENLRGFHRGRMRLKACLLAVMTGLAGPDAYSEPRATVGSRRQALRFMDVGCKDYISAEDLKRALRLLDEDLSDEELTHMMQASTGRPGEQHTHRILYKDFMKLVPPLCPSHVFKGGDTIYSAGSMDRNLFLINQGEVALEVEGRASKRRQSAGDESIAVVTLQTLQRGDSFGEGELLAAAEAEEVSMAATVPAVASKNKDTEAGGNRASTNTSALSWTGRHAPNEDPGRGAARGEGVPRAARAVCVSEACEVMVVPRHLFANLLDELGGVRRKLEVQAKSHASTALAKLVDEDTYCLDSHEEKYPTNADIWLPRSTSGSVGTGARSTGVEPQKKWPWGGGRGAQGGDDAMRRGEATILLVREGSVVVTQGGVTRNVGAGEACVCGVPRQGIPPVTRVACSPQEPEATVVSVPVESLRRGGLFTPASLDSFLRLLSVGCYGLSGATPSKDAAVAASEKARNASSPLWQCREGRRQQLKVEEGGVSAVDVWGVGA